MPQARTHARRHVAPLAAAVLFMLGFHAAVVLGEIGGEGVCVASGCSAPGSFAWTLAGRRAALFYRSQCNYGDLKTCASNDGGATWGPPGDIGGTKPGTALLASADGANLWLACAALLSRKTGRAFSARSGEIPLENWELLHSSNAGTTWTTAWSAREVLTSDSLLLADRDGADFVRRDKSGGLVCMRFTIGKDRPNLRCKVSEIGQPVSVARCREGNLAILGHPASALEKFALAVAPVTGVVTAQAREVPWLQGHEPLRVAMAASESAIYIMSIEALPAATGTFASICWTPDAGVTWIGPRKLQLSSDATAGTRTARGSPPGRIAQTWDLAVDGDEVVVAGVTEPQKDRPSLRAFGSSHGGEFSQLAEVPLRLIERLPHGAAQQPLWPRNPHLFLTSSGLLYASTAGTGSFDAVRVPLPPGGGRSRDRAERR
ncbi:MAG: hypothetical protein HY303_06715 [Candidatus Wallbacteria bacterium]|nr:hypothetical protein [Candidatus Wallbacteria bacterium]